MNINDFLKNKEVESYILNSAKFHALELVKKRIFSILRAGRP